MPNLVDNPFVFYRLQVSLVSNNGDRDCKKKSNNRIEKGGKVVVSRFRVQTQ